MLGGHYPPDYLHSPVVYSASRDVKLEAVRLAFVRSPLQCTVNVTIWGFLIFKGCWQVPHLTKNQIPGLIKV